MKVALVYDRVNKIGGAERVIKALSEIWPEAPLYTSVYQKSSASWAKSIRVITSPLNKIPFFRTRHEWLAWAMPQVFESFDLSEFDVVISVTSAEAKGVITSPSTLHVCYLLTPTRYLWSHTFLYQQGEYVTNKNWITRKLTPFIFSRLRIWDALAASRPDYFVAISKTVASRCLKYYRREVDAIIYPPVIDFPKANSRDIDLPADYYLLVSRLVPYKRIDLAIDVFNRNGKNLVIVGQGASRSQLKAKAKDNITFAGKVTQSKLSSYYAHAQALVFPAEEDFGLVSVEAQSFGVPVIAYGKGGSAETVIDGKTGVLFKEQTSDALDNALKKFEKLSFRQEDCIINARLYSVKLFKQKIANYVEEKWRQHQK